jgi:hypothetical protein
MKWTRYRFHANYDDFRPVKFPPPGPYWCSGTSAYGDDDPSRYSIVIAYLPQKSKLTEFWPEASEIDSEITESILYTDRFQKPEWWKGE